VLEGLRGGHTFISHQPPYLGGPQIRLEADGNGDGQFESMVGDTVRPGTALRARVLGGGGSLLRVITDRGRQAFDPIAVTGDSEEHRFRLPAGATWVRAEIFDPDLARERGVVCDDAIGSETTYCRNLLLVLAMTSALYLRADAPAVPVGVDGPVARGTARLRPLGRRCRRRPFSVTVSGREIQRVTFSLDRRRLRGVRRRGERFRVRIDPRRLQPGRHRVGARVTFRSASATGARTLRSRFSVCARRAQRRSERRASPRFAG